MKSRTITGPRRFKGELRVPGDKSITHRAVLLGSVARGETVIHRPLTGLDCRATASAVEMLGAKVKRGPTAWRVTGVGPGVFAEPADVIDCGNSGTSIRLLAGLLAGHPITAFLTGDESIRRRPMARVLGPLAAMGAVVLGSAKDTRAPFGIRGGGVKAMAHTLPIASAQVKSAILLAGLRAEGVTSVAEPATSRDHTERMLLHFGAALTAGKLKGPAALDAREVAVPGDVSSAAFFLVGASGAPGSSLLLAEVGVNPTRTGALDALGRMGARIKRENEREAGGEPVADLVVTGTDALRSTEIGGQEIPLLVDEIPVLALAAARASGTTRITGAKELRVKESDRIATTAKLLRAFGATCDELEDGLVVGGGARLVAAKIASQGDHRIAMTGAIAACWARGESTIEDVACVETSFPGFFEELERVTEPVA